MSLAIEPEACYSQDAEIIDMEDVIGDGEIIDEPGDMEDVIGDGEIIDEPGNF